MVRNVIMANPSKQTNIDKVNRINNRKALTKGKSESLHEKLNKTNIKDMKEHLYIPAAFFEQFKEIFILPHEAERIYNIPKPNNFNLSHLKTFTYMSPDIPKESLGAIESYGDYLMESYLKNVI
jgi:hypothetical protein